MAQTRITTHAVTSTFYPGSSTEPWQRCYGCTCGVDLDVFDEQGLGSADVESAFQEHVESLPKPSIKAG